jgi:hypothetical protein
VRSSGMILPHMVGEGDHRAAMVEGEATGAGPLRHGAARHATSPASRGRIKYGASLALCALLTACAHNPPPAPPAPQPPPPQVQRSMCDAPVPADRAALCVTLAKLNEHALPDAWRDIGGPIVRVTMIPAGQPALSIRVLGNSMTVKRLSHSAIDVARVVTLSPDERQALIDAGAKTWGSLNENADAPTFAACKSANYIAAETNFNGVVKFAVSHCVALKPLRDLADAYLRIASEKVPELKQGLEQSLD